MEWLPDSLSSTAAVTGAAIVVTGLLALKPYQRRLAARIVYDAMPSKQVPCGKPGLLPFDFSAFNADPIASARSLAAAPKVSFLFYRPMIAFGTADAAKDLLAPPLARKFTRQTFVRGSSNVMNTEGKEHAKHAKVMGTALSHRNLSMLPAIVSSEFTSKLLPLLQPGDSNSNTKDIELDMSTASDSLVADSIIRFLYSNEEPRIETLLHATRIVNTMFQSPLGMAAFMFPPIRKLPIGRFREMNKAYADLKVVEDIINEVKSKTDEERAEMTGFFQCLVAASEGSRKPLTDEELRGDAMAIMVGGNDSTTSGLLWTLYCLAAHPGERAKVWQEIRDARMDDPSTPLAYDTIALRMPILDRAVKEALRLYAPFGGTLLRHPREDVVIDGVRIPQGTTVVTSAIAVHYDGTHYPDPDEYQPDRWVVIDRDPTRHSHAYLPWGMGVQACLGKRLALGLIKGYTVELLRHADFELSSAMQLPMQVTRKNGQVLVPKGGLKLTCHPR